MNSEAITIQAGDTFLDLPRLPLMISSNPQIWPGIRLELNRVPEGEMPPLVAFDRHVISASLGPQPLRRYWRQDGREQSVLFAPGDVGLISRQQVAGIRFGASHDLLVLGIDDFRLGQVFQEELSGHPAELTVVPSATDPILMEMLLLLKQEVALGHPGGRLFGDSVINAIICHVLPRYGTFKPLLKSHHRGLSLPRLRRVVEYIHAYLETDLGVAELASVSELSQYHFAKLFHRSMGRSIHQYVLDIRIRRAQEMIDRGRMSLAAIGAQVGLTNPSQFTATFRRRTGLTPSEYRRGCGIRSAP